MAFFHNYSVSSVLKSSCTILYTAVLRAVLTPQGGTEVLVLAKTISFIVVPYEGKVCMNNSINTFGG